jgi:hypothetical protein
MKKLLTSLILFCAALLPAQTVKLCWNPSPGEGVVNYRIYYGTNSGCYSSATNAGLALTQTVVLPHSGRWFFAATALDADGYESDFSNEVGWEVKPAPPVVHGETWVRLVPVLQRSTNLVDWSPLAGEPTLLPATQAQEFFTLRELQIERVQLVKQP